MGKKSSILHLTRLEIEYLTRKIASYNRSKGNNHLNIWLLILCDDSIYLRNRPVPEEFEKKAIEAMMNSKWQLTFSRRCTYFLIMKLKNVKFLPREKVSLSVGNVNIKDIASETKMITIVEGETSQTILLSEVDYERIDEMKLCNIGVMMRSLY